MYSVKTNQGACTHGPFADRHEAERMMVELTKRSDIRPPIQLIQESAAAEPETPSLPQRRLMVEAAPHIAAMVSNNSEVRPPTLTGNDARDIRVVDAFLANVAQQASGTESVAHDGSTFLARKEAAQAILRIWDEITA
jgi:hypothetical protein